MTMRTEPDVIDELFARCLAGGKLPGAGLTLCSGALREEDGWRFAVRLARSPDWVFTGQEMTVTVFVSDAEVKAGTGAA